MVTTQTLELGKQALDRHAWDEALEAFSEADREGRLSADDLELLAEAAWWSGYPDDALEALERAYAAHERADDHTAAAEVALRLAELAFKRFAPAALQGWLASAERLLEDVPPSPVHARLALMRAPGALMIQHDLDQALSHVEQAIEFGRAHGNRDVETLATSLKGQLLIKKGRWMDGLALIDEAAAAATSGEIGASTACDIYCNTIAACRNLGDYQRAGEWTDRATRWMQRQSITGYPGICRVHRAELQRLRGEWPEAEQEARHACDELERFRLMSGVGFAYAEIGEVRLRMGDLDAAEEALVHANEYGHSAQPGLSELLLARGQPDEAARSIARALARPPEEDPNAGGSEDVLERARLLPTQVEIALVRDDLDTAGAATEELEEIAEHYDSVAWEAAALTARGSLMLYRDEHEQAIQRLERAWRLWQEIELPYDSAQARLMLGQAHAALGDTTAARMELQAARSVFERLGATADLHRANELLGEEGVTPRARRQRVVKTFMFTDIVTSTDLVSLIGDEPWEELLRWHDQTMRTAFVRHGGEEVTHTGDGFFVAFETSADAIACAVAIQRTLAAHRRDHGFAPWVRIGLHTAEATRDRDDYRGQGVHAAARVGALAGREEIVVSGAVLEAAGDVSFPVSDPETVQLKGIPEPMEVHTIDWN